MKLLCDWLEYSTGVRKVLGSIPPGDSGFFFVLCSWHVHHIISHRTSHVTNLITMRKISCPPSLAFLFVTCKVRHLTPALHSKISIVCHSRCIWKSWCLRREKKNGRSLSEQRWQPTTILTHKLPWLRDSNTTFVEGECSHHWATLATLFTLLFFPDLEIRGVGGRHPDP